MPHKSETPQPTATEGALDYIPKTELVKKLLELRMKIVESGQPLLTHECLEQEIAERRGGVDDQFS
jgi:hypothetical protein